MLAAAAMTFLVYVGYGYTPKSIRQVRRLQLIESSE